MNLEKRYKFGILIGILCVISMVVGVLMMRNSGNSGSSGKWIGGVIFVASLLIIFLILRSLLNFDIHRPHKGGFISRYFAADFAADNNYLYPDDASNVV